MSTHPAPPGHIVNGAALDPVDGLRSITRRKWTTLAACMSGWGMAGFDVALFALIVGPAVTDLLGPGAAPGLRALNPFGWRATLAVALLPALLVLFIRRHVREPESTAHLRADRRARRAGTAFFGGNLGIAVTALNGFLVLGVIGALLSRETRGDYRPSTTDRATTATHF